MKSVAFERTTDVTAAAAVGSVWWYDYISEFSQLAADFLPIFGVLWLTVQILNKLYHWNHPHK